MWGCCGLMEFDGYRVYCAATGNHAESLAQRVATCARAIGSLAHHHRGCSLPIESCGVRCRDHGLQALRSGVRWAVCGATAFWRRSGLTPAARPAGSPHVTNALVGEGTEPRSERDPAFHVLHLRPRPSDAQADTVDGCWRDRFVAGPSRNRWPARHLTAKPTHYRRVSCDF